MADNYVNKTGLTYFYNRIKTIFSTKDEVTEGLSGKVDKETGKGLSTNDLTATLKSHYDAAYTHSQSTHAPTNAQANVIETVKVNGTALTPSSKAVDVTVPTKTSDLTNDSDYVSDAAYVHTDTNFTSAEKTKLGGVASGAQANVLESVKMNGTALTITSKAVDIPQMGAATASADGKAGVVPAPAKGKQTAFLRGDGTWVVPTNTNTTYTLSQDAEDGHKVTLTPSSGTAQTITIPDNDTTYEEATESAAGLMSTAMVTKLKGIAAGANKTTVDSSLSSTSTNPVQNKAINTALGNKAPIASPTFTGTPKAPTAAAGTNTEQIATTEFVTSAVSTAIAGVTQIKYEVVSTLPATGAAGTIYLVAHSHGTSDAYDEYIYVNSKWEKIGNTDIDLSGYWAKTDLTAITTGDIDALFA